jgi:hypothetical protein
MPHFDGGRDAAAQERPVAFDLNRLCTLLYLYLLALNTKTTVL